MITVFKVYTSYLSEEIIVKEGREANSNKSIRQKDQCG